MDYFLLLFIRTLAVYFIVLLVFRIMGKRELGELSILDFVVFLFIAEVAALSIENMDTPFFETMLPVAYFVIIQVGMSWIVLKSKKIRSFIEGEAILIIEKGVINEHAMRKERYNLDDLTQQLREQGVRSVQDVARAFLEQSGKLSVFLKSDGTYVYPLILDGEIDVQNLQRAQLTEQWLVEQLEARGYRDSAQIFFCFYEREELYIQLKARK